MPQTPDPLDQLPDDVAAAAFRRLVRHLRHRHDAENIDLMGLAGFCRNCLADWIRDNKADLAILSLTMMSDADDLPGLMVSALASEDMVVAEQCGGKAVPPYYEADDLIDRPLVLSEMLAAIVRRQLGNTNHAFQFDVDIDSVQAIKTMVLRGQGARSTSPRRTPRG